MAFSGSFSGSIRSGHYMLRVDWSQTQNVSNNTSTITCKLYLVNDWSLSINSRDDNSCTINGTAKTYASPSISSTGTHLLGTVSQSVPHNNDGTKSVQLSAVFYIRATLSGTYYDSISASATVTLDSIARASAVSANSCDMNAATTISISRAASSFTHTLTYLFGNASGTIATKTTSTSVSWTPTISLASQIPNATSGVCTITCTTYSGSTTIGTKTCTLTLSVPASVKPTISSLGAARVDGNVPAAWGLYVQSKSKAMLTINGAAGAYGSTIKSYSISGGGYSGTGATLTTGFLNSSGMIKFTATVTDSRGRTSAAATVSITVTAYSAPAFTSTSAIRCTSSGSISASGTNIRALCVFSFASCGGKNTLTATVQFKKSSVQTWSSGGNLTSNTAAIIGGGAITTDSSYDVRYTLTDAFGSVYATDSVSTASVVMDFKAGGTGVAVGKVAETDNCFEVSDKWGVKVYGKLLKDYIKAFLPALYPVGSIYMSVNNVNPSTYFGGTWVAWGSGRVPVGVNANDSNFNTVEKTGGAATVTLTTDQIASHSHGKGTLANNNTGAHTHDIQNQKSAWGTSGSNRVLIDATSGYTAVTNKKTTSAGGHAHTISGSTAAAGGGKAHTNLQPYITCYMWKRTA